MLKSENLNRLDLLKESLFRSTAYQNGNTNSNASFPAFVVKYTMKLIAHLDNIASGKEIFILTKMIICDNFSTLGMILLKSSLDAGFFDPKVKNKYS